MNDIPDLTYLRFCSLVGDDGEPCSLAMEAVLTTGGVNFLCPAHDRPNAPVAR